MKKLLLVADPLAKLDMPNDSSISMMKVLYREQFEVFYLDFVNFANNSFKSARLQKLEKVKSFSDNVFIWSEAVEASLKSIDIVLHRKDPPVNEDYRRGCLALAALLPQALHINNPKLIGELSEKLIIDEFPEFAIPSLLIHSIEELKKEVAESSGELVLKPTNLFSGQGIHFIDSQTPAKTLEDAWKNFGPEMILQPLVPEAESLGDLRVLTFNKKIMGAFLRKAKEGSRLQNLHQGGSAHPWELSEVQKKAVSQICDKLGEKGLHLLGIDFLGDKLSEINFTSPMGFVQINEVYNTRSEELFAKECLKMLEKEK